MPKFPQSPFSTMIFNQSPVFTPVAPFAHSFTLKAQFYPNNLISTPSHFGTRIFHMSPVFTVTVQFSPKCPFTLVFPKSPIYLKFSTEALFYPSRPFHTLIFPKSPNFTQEPHFYPKDLISTSSLFLYEPCFHLSSPVFTKVSFSHTHFSQKPHFPQSAQISSKSLQHTDFPHKPSFAPSSPFRTLIFPKSPILPERPNFHLK